MSTQAAGGRPSAVAARGLGGWASPFLLFAGSCLFYAVNLDQPPLHDELYHVLAARGLLETGEPRIADGLYARGLVWTWLVAQSMALFGDGLAAARLPSVVMMAGLVTLLFVWLRREVGPAPAWLITLLFASSPFAVELARYCRFYGLQMLLFLLAAWWVHAGVLGLRRGGVRPLVLLGAAALLLLAAFELQPVTLFGVAGLALWAGAATMLPLLLDPTRPPASRWRLALLLGGLVVAVVLAALLSGTAEALWDRLRSSPAFQAETRNEFWYYHAWNALYYPSLWPATALLALLALAGAGASLGWLALTVYATAFTLQSLAGPKSLRYLAYAQPFLFILWGLGLAFLARAAARWLEQGLAPMLAPRLGGSLWLARAAIIAALAGMALANPAWLRSALELAGRPAPGREPPADWALAAPALLPHVAAADVVVTSEEVSALYYLGRFDVNISASKLLEFSSGKDEFARDYRTGRPVISTAASLEQVLACYPSGLILGSLQDWGMPHLITPEIAALITVHARRIELPRASRVYAYAWDTPRASAAADCGALRERLGTPLGQP